MAEDDLEALFAEARALRTEPGSDLTARILADAQAVAGERRAPARPAPSLPRAGWRDWPAGLGGWPAMGGLAASTVAGLWIGWAPPAALADAAQGLAGWVWGDGVAVAVGLDDPLDWLEG
jgi:hypothetical protein